MRFNGNADIREEDDMDKKTLDIAYFVSFCIEQYKKEKGLTGAETISLMNQFGVLEYLSEHFETLHTQSYQWIMKDIDEYIHLRSKR